AQRVAAAQCRRAHDRARDARPDRRRVGATGDSSRRGTRHIRCAFDADTCRRGDEGSSMTTNRLLQQAARSMRRYPLRTIIMMLGSFVGVALLMFVLSVGRGAKTLMLRTVRQILGDQAILVMAGGGTMM